MSFINRSLLWSLPLAAALAAGCSKHQPPADANAAANAAQADASAAPGGPPRRGPGEMAAPPPTTIAESGDMNATLNQLSMELRKYVVRTRSVPKDFEEFIAKSHVQAPPPPPGKKYAIRDQAIVLVKL